MILQQVIQKLTLHQDLEPILCQDAFKEALKNECNKLQATAFLALLHAKPETPEELTNIVQLLTRLSLFEIAIFCNILILKMIFQIAYG